MVARVGVTVQVSVVRENGTVMGGRVRPEPRRETRGGGRVGGGVADRGFV